MTPSPYYIRRKKGRNCCPAKQVGSPITSINSFFKGVLRDPAGHFIKCIYRHIRAINLSGGTKIFSLSQITLLCYNYVVDMLMFLIDVIQGLKGPKRGYRGKDCFPLWE